MQDESIKIIETKVFLDSGTLKPWLAICLIALALWLGLSKGALAVTCPASLSFTFPRLQDEAPQSLCQYQGKVIMVVNTASYCGFTSQYEGLEKLYAKYKDQGLVILGFPTNDFGKQEPGSNKEIAEFCHNTYGVKFPMFAKTTLSGKDANPFFDYLIRETNTKPKWNFYKYVINRHGKVVESFSSLTAPESKKVVDLIEKLIKEN